MFFEKISRMLFSLEDWLFETRYGLQLGGIVQHSSLSSENPMSLAHATAYHAVWCRNLRELFTEANKTGIVCENFIDIGSGKG